MVDALLGLLMLLTGGIEFMWNASVWWWMGMLFILSASAVLIWGREHRWW